MQALRTYAEQAALTRDGFRVEIAANIGTPDEAVGLLGKGAEGVGLYRTEFLFMSRDLILEMNTPAQVREALQAFI